MEPDCTISRWAPSKLDLAVYTGLYGGSTRIQWSEMPAVNNETVGQRTYSGSALVNLDIWRVQVTSYINTVMPGCTFTIRVENINTGGDELYLRIAPPAGYPWVPTGFAFLFNQVAALPPSLDLGVPLFYFNPVRYY
jgi:hypothetical protein